MISLQSPRSRVLLLLVLLMAGLGVSVVMENSAVRLNDGPGFPLDDPWIHLQFAKNLHDFGSYSYFKNEMVTSGSTSPLYTFLLAGGFFFTNNEMLLSYALGVVFLLLGAVFLFRLALHLWEGAFVFAAGTTMLFILEPRMQWAALSGMETTLFIFLLLAALYYYRTRRPLLLGITAGLLIWARPEALIFVGVLGVDVLYRAAWVKSTGGKSHSPAESRSSLAWLRLPLILFVLFGSGYAAFNLLLSGTVMPNTYAAKLTYYAGGGSTFPSQVFHFLVDGHLIVFSIFAAAGIVAAIVRAVERKPNPMLIPLAWSAAMFLAYWKNLPYLYQQGRYLMPILPFVLLLGVDGLQWVSDYLKRIPVRGDKGLRGELIVAMFILLFTIQSAIAVWSEMPAYAGQCRYISDRQVRTARWIRDNLPAQSVIATHDIGAISFYSGRRVADMVGLVSPEMILGIGRYDKLQQFLTKQGATHLAVLRNWFDVSDQNPLFLTDEQQPEIMEVFAYVPGRTHFASGEDQRLENVAAYYLSRGQAPAVAQGLEQYFRGSPGTARLHALSGQASLMLGNLDNAERGFKNALVRCPGCQDAELGLAEVAAQRGNTSAAVDRLESLVRLLPSYVPAYRELAMVYERSLGDSVKGRETLRRYEALLLQEKEKPLR